MEKSFLIPANTVCRCQMMIRPGEAGQGEDYWLAKAKTIDALYMKTEFTVVAGPYAGRKVYQNIILSGGKLDDTDRPISANRGTGGGALMETDITKRIGKISDEFAEQIGRASDGLYLFLLLTNGEDFDADKLDWLSEVSHKGAVKANDLFRELLAITNKLAEKVTGEKIFFGDVREYNNPHKDYWNAPGKKAEAE
ncbi:MAG: hypothetical protein HQK58_12330 [Deltaproteobacteria bacterium]|nr:hypothetical protein [Deltaproteobacteria bacterium]